MPKSANRSSNAISLRKPQVDERGTGRDLIELAHHRLPISPQHRLLSIADADDRCGISRHVSHGSRQMVRRLRRKGHDVGGRRVRRLMAKMRPSSIYQRLRTSDPHPQHWIYAYLLRKLEIDRTNKVWLADDIRFSNHQIGIH